MSLTGIAIGLTLGIAAWSQAPRIDGEGLLPVRAADRKALEEQLGIQILALRLTSEGAQIGLRFRVTDAQKAAPLFDRDRPHLIDPASGAKLCAAEPPRRDAPQGVRPEQGRDYVIVFGNARGNVKGGDSVTVLVGDYRVEGIVVFASVGPAVFE